MPGPRRVSAPGTGIRDLPWPDLRPEVEITGIST